MTSAPRVRCDCAARYSRQHKGQKTRQPQIVRSEKKSCATFRPWLRPPSQTFARSFPQHRPRVRPRRSSGLFASTCLAGLSCSLTLVVMVCSARLLISKKWRDVCWPRLAVPFRFSTSFCGPLPAPAANYLLATFRSCGVPTLTCSRLGVHFLALYKHGYTNRLVRLRSAQFLTNSVDFTPSLTRWTPNMKKRTGRDKRSLRPVLAMNARGSRPRVKWLRPLVLAVQVDADIKRMVVPVGVMAATPLPISFHAVDRVAHLGAVVTMTSGFTVDPLFIHPQTIVAVPAPIMIRARDAGYRHRNAQRSASAPARAYFKIFLVMCFLPSHSA